MKIIFDKWYNIPEDLVKEAFTAAVRRNDLTVLMILQDHPAIRPEAKVAAFITALRTGHDAAVWLFQDDPAVNPESTLLLAAQNGYSSVSVLMGNRRVSDEARKKAFDAACQNRHATAVMDLATIYPELCIGKERVDWFFANEDLRFSTLFEWYQKVAEIR